MDLSLALLRPFKVPTRPQPLFSQSNSLLKIPNMTSLLHISLAKITKTTQKKKQHNDKKRRQKTCNKHNHALCTTQLRINNEIHHTLITLARNPPAVRDPFILTKEEKERSYWYQQPQQVVGMHTSAGTDWYQC
jgi:hypothetical protein